MSVGKEERRKPRVPESGAVLWSYATDPRVPQYEAALIDDNSLGLGMVSERPIRESSVVRVAVKSLWRGERYATVMRCDQLAPDAYEIGLIYVVVDASPL